MVVLQGNMRLRRLEVTALATPGPGAQPPASRGSQRQPCSPSYFRGWGTGGTTCFGWPAPTAGPLRRPAGCGWASGWRDYLGWRVN